MSHLVMGILLIGTLGAVMTEESLEKHRGLVSMVIAVTGVLAHWFAVEQFGYGALYLLYMSMGMLLLVLGVMDLVSMTLPVPLTMMGYVIGGSVLVYEGPDDWWLQVMIAGCVLVFLSLLNRAMKGDFGEGDAHVLAWLALGLGWIHCMAVFMVALVLSAVTGIALMVFAGKGRKTALPFVPFIALAHLLLLVF